MALTSQPHSFQLIKPSTVQARQFNTGTKHLFLSGPFVRKGVQISQTRNGSSKTMAVKDELLIVGPGVLGTYLGKLWVDAGGPATGQTNTITNHGRLATVGINACTKEEASGSFSNVAFTAPPSGSPDFLGDIERALSLWNEQGSFVYTSSIGVYDTKGNAPLTEDSRVKNLGESERVDKLLNAETTVLRAGGNIVRLAGLYHANRGPHTAFLRMGKVDMWGGYRVNLLHYEDAAALVFEVLSGGASFRGKVFLGYDGNPLSFEDMMSAVSASRALSGEVTFVGSPEQATSKCLDNTMTVAELQGRWAPKHPSFARFMENGAHDWYNDSGVF